MTVSPPVAFAVAWAGTARTVSSSARTARTTAGRCRGSRVTRDFARDRRHPASAAPARSGTPAAPPPSPAVPHATSDTSTSASDSSPPVASSRKWWTVLWTRRPSAVNQKSMLPRRPSTRPWMPVSSATSRTAVSSCVSPDSTWPFGSDHRSRPRRSRPADEDDERALVELVEHQPTGRGLLDAPGWDGRPGTPTRRRLRTGGTCSDRRQRSRCVPASPQAAGRVRQAAARTLWARGDDRPPGTPRRRRARRRGAAADPPPRRSASASCSTTRGHALHLVGGSVRDLLLDRSAATPDLDFTTDARPEQVLALAAKLGAATWDVGIAFGTVGLHVDGIACEVTTYRSESLRPRLAQPGRPVRRHARGRPAAARLHRQRDGGVGAPAGVRRPVRRARRPRARAAAHACARDGVVHRRSAAHAARPRASPPSSGCSPTTRSSPR